MTHQYSAICRLEALFNDIKIDQDGKIKEENDKKCCNIHGKHSKENCVTRRGSLNVLYPSAKSQNSIDTFNRRSSLNLPNLSIKKEMHPSFFPNTLRRDSLTASTGTISQFRRHPTANLGASLVKNSNSISMQKDKFGSLNSSLRQDSTASSMINLQGTSEHVENKRQGDQLFNESLHANLYSNNDTINDGFTSINKPNGNLRSCIAGSRGDSKGNFNVVIKSDPLFESGHSKKNLTVDFNKRRGSIDMRRFSTDSLDNNSRYPWNTNRRECPESSGNWDDVISEESDKVTVYVLCVEIFNIRSTKMCTKYFLV